MKYRLRKVRAWLNGMREFRLTYCTAYHDIGLTRAYDHERELVHRLTLRQFEPH
jgi:hypothetical protein